MSSSKANVVRVPALGVFAVLAALASAPAALAQGAAPSAPPDTVKVFIDCMGARCDYEYIRTEVRFVDHVRDREVADVHLLITNQGTSGGGEFTLHFIGRGPFEGVDGTLVLAWKQVDTGDVTRASLVRTIKLGLVPYVSRTAMRDRLDVGFTGGARPEPPGRAAADPWNAWIFRTQANTRVDGESSSSSASYSGAMSGSRVTDAWKLSFSGSGSYRESRYDLAEGDTYRSISRGLGVAGLAVKSLTRHWSVGARAAASSSTYLNQRLALRLAPAVEYDLVPYSESTRRKITIQYAVGADYFRYDRVTIFGKTSERKMDNAIVAALDLRRPWGSMSSGVEVGSYLDDFSKKRLQMSGEANLRLLKGLSLSVYGSAAVIRDQIYLPSDEATAEEILVRQRQLATSYRYSMSIGFSYTFGSIYTNVVNPRLTGGFGQPW
jgi:hypothetical protein